ILKVRAPAPPPADLRQELKQRKAELLPVLHAINWLRVRLGTPQHIAAVLAEWIVEKDCQNDRRREAEAVAALMVARWALGVEAFVGTDNKMWWRLSQETTQ